MNPGLCANKPDTKHLKLGTALIHVQSRLSTHLLLSCDVLRWYRPEDGPIICSHVLKFCHGVTEGLIVES